MVFAFGSPFGLENSVTMGVVSSAARQVQPDGPMIYVQTDAPINPGNSGGPLVDADGKLVGINTFIVSASGGSAGVGFAAPSNIVQSVFEQIRKTGAVRRGQIGVIAQTITPALAASPRLKPGTRLTRSSKLVALCCSSVSPPSTVIDIGTSASTSLRFVAVTMISSSGALLCACAAAGGATARPAERSKVEPAPVVSAICRLRMCYPSCEIRAGLPAALKWPRIIVMAPPRQAVVRYG